MPTLTVTLVTGRTIEQGTSKEKGKFSDEYQQSVSICLLDPEDMKKLNIKDDTPVKIQTPHGAVIVHAKTSKRSPHAGIAFIPYGPWANMLTDTETGGTGMPTLKGIPAQIEPAPNEQVPRLKELVRQAFGEKRE